MQKSYRTIVALVAAAVVSGCGGQGRIIKARFMDEFRCDDVQVQRVAGGTHRASGCGHTAVYTCERDICIRDRDGYGYGYAPGYGAPYPPGPYQPVPYQAGPYQAAPYPPPPGNVERQFDPQRQIHLVRGRFRLSAPQNELILVGAPQYNPTAVFVQAVVRGDTSPYRDCQALRLRINDQPFDGQDVKVGTGGQQADASGNFPLHLFDPIVRSYSTFDVELCGQRLGFDGRQMQDLLTFLGIFSQIASDVQQGRLPAQYPPAAQPTPAPPPSP